MRAKDFITESSIDDCNSGLDIVTKSLPNTYIIPDLQNQDAYTLYRFGLAMAAVRGEEGEKRSPVHEYPMPEFKSRSKWGEQLIITDIDDKVDDLIDAALRKVGLSSKTPVSTQTSDEYTGTHTSSPVSGFKGYKRR